MRCAQRRLGFLRQTLGFGSPAPLAQRGAGIDVNDVEPPAADHPFRTMDNVTVTPHIGYVTHETLKAFYSDTVEAVAAFASGSPIRIANPDALNHPKQRRS